MDGNQFAKYLLDTSKAVEDYINNDAPDIMGKMAVDHFTEGFQNEGFTDEKFEKWEEVKRRTNPKNWHYVTKGKNKGDRISGSAYAARKILTGDTADLGMSIDFKRGNAETTVFSDKDYSEAHNEGTNNAGRNRSVTIPKRKFIGDSKVLNENILTEFGNDLDNIIKKSP